MIVQAILVGPIAAWGSLGYAFGTLYTLRPIVLGPLAGLALGDAKTGAEIGISLELLFTAAISVSAYTPSDVNIRGVLATAFAIPMGKGVDAAVVLVMPIVVMSLGTGNLVSTTIPVYLKIVDDGAAQGNDSKATFMQWLMGVFVTSYRFLSAFGAFYIRTDKVQDLLDFISQLILDGMRVAAGILPAMGSAMPVRMITSKKLIPFFFLGFVLTSYANIPVLGVAIIAVIIAVEKFGSLEGEPQLVGNAKEVGDDGDF